MNRLPQTDMLDGRIQNGRVAKLEIGKIADLLADA